MERETTALFISETPGAHGIYDQRTETARELYVHVRSVSRREVYEAMSVGHTPEISIILEHDFEYQNERIVVLNGTRYQVLRTYVNEWDQMEITLERSVNQNV